MSGALAAFVRETEQADDVTGVVVQRGSATPPAQRWDADGGLSRRSGGEVGQWLGQRCVPALDEVSLVPVKVIGLNSGARAS